VTNKLLITGGCGFVGVNLVAYLRQVSDCDITVLDNLSLGRREYIEPYRTNFIEGDIRDPQRVREAMAGVTGIVHLAADTRVIESVRDPANNFDVNVRGTFCLLEAARELAIKNFVFASTGGAIIGPAEPPVHEEMVPRPTAPYGASKLFGEGYLSAYSGSFGLKAVSLRFSNVYGPRSHHKGSAVAAFLKSVLENKTITVYGDGQQTRDFVHVDDICAAINRALSYKGAGGVYQLGSGVGTSINELLLLIKTIVGAESMPDICYLPFRTGELVHTHSSIHKASTELGYKPTKLLADGIRETWDWFSANRLSSSASAF
jgi:UDP-glucose 4-epimerase